VSLPSDPPDAGGVGEPLVEQELLCLGLAARICELTATRRCISFIDSTPPGRPLKGGGSSVPMLLSPL
jgi:hypothetical protein